MIDSQPSASRPRNARPRGRREPGSRRESVSRRDLGAGARFQVQLELAPLVIDDPALAALLLQPRRSPSAFVAPPPPPPVLTLGLAPRPSLEARPVRPRVESIPDSAITLPMATRVLYVEPEIPPATSSIPVPCSRSRSRSLELSFVSALSVVATLAAVAVAQRASHWGEARAPIPESRTPSTQPERVALGESKPVLSLLSALAPSIPVVEIAQLPIEGLPQVPRAASEARHSPTVGADRAALLRALSRAANAAKSCGAGPVQSQVVATFGPSGVVRGVHFGASAPPTVLRSCVLRAIARARVPPFVGEPVTVSKNVSW